MDSKNILTVRKNILVIMMWLWWTNNKIEGTVKSGRWFSLSLCSNSYESTDL